MGGAWSARNGSRNEGLKGGGCEECEKRAVGPKEGGGCKWCEERVEGGGGGSERDGGHNSPLFIHKALRIRSMLTKEFLLPLLSVIALSFGLGMWLFPSASLPLVTLAPWALIYSLTTKDPLAMKLMQADTPVNCMGGGGAEARAHASHSSHLTAILVGQNHCPPNVH